MAGFRLPLTTAALFFCAQLLLAWHLPAHLETPDQGPLSLVNAADCDICLSGPGSAPAPALAACPPRPATEQTSAFSGASLAPQTTIPGAGPRAPPALS